MLKALFTSATGMKAQQLSVDNTANNLANVNTTGFKRNQLGFQDLLYVTKRSAGTDTAQGLQLPTGLQIGSGVRPSSNPKIFTQGVLENTDNKLDVAIEGDGFLQVNLPSGEVRYTRDGALRLNSTGNLVNTEGYLVQPQITIPQDTLSVSIGTDGTVSVLTAGSPTTATIAGNLTVVRFPNPAGLSAEGSNFFSETSASGSPTTGTPGADGYGALRQGFLERSNVEVVSELVNLILAQRAYEINSRAIKTGDEMLATSNNITQ